jgi:hypothetical protein
MQPVLIDCRQLAAQAAIEILDNLGITLHPTLLAELLRIERGRHLSTFGSSLEFARRLIGQSVSQLAVQACFCASA